MRICQNEQRVAHTDNNTYKPAIYRLQNANNGSVPRYSTRLSQKPTRLGIELHGNFFGLFYAQIINRLVGNAASVGQLVCDDCNRIPLCAIDIASKSLFLRADKIRALDIRPDIEFFYFFSHISRITLCTSQQEYQKTQNPLYRAGFEKENKRSVNGRYQVLSSDGI